MIKAGIAGGGSDAAGEIIRILGSHPDVEILWVYDPELEGTPVADIHRGLRGDTYMRFTDTPDVDQADVIFLCYFTPEETERFITRHQVSADKRLIDFSDRFITDSFTSHPSPDAAAHPGEWVFGLPELMRKPLVRGATRAIVPSPLATAVTIGLLPLAKAGLLTAPVTIAATVSAAEGAAGETVALIDHEALDHCRLALTTLLPEGAPAIPALRTIITSAGWTRGTAVTAFLDSPAPLKDLLEVYDAFFNDHNFTYVIDELPILADVAGTNKTLIHLDEVGGQTTVTVVLDDTLKGSSANAVHLMNLIFGLSERVGLQLKATTI
ncbi:MAG: hypothetical protein NC342_07655 [Pseudoflavonifractor sp.]|nr:hypothetical protein [Alloprevotella sp.]MCM1117395.1 hypothetical protein [Pseudoflavonifractor sp.]